MQRLRFLVWKEFLELRLNPRLFGVVVVAPIIQLTLLGYAATTDIKDVPLVVADGDRYTLGPGDVFWTAAGCVHAFYETQGKPVRWLETSAPGPPARHSYRFERDWEYLASVVTA